MKFYRKQLKFHQKTYPLLVLFFKYDILKISFMTNLKEKSETTKKEFNLDLEEMTRAGLHFGHRASRVHPKIMPYLGGIKNTVHIFDLEKTAEKFKTALEFIQELISENKNLLIVGTKIQIKELVRNMAIECGLPYVVERWIGGTFTNFEVVRKRIEYFKDLERKKTGGELEKYTKKERAKIDRKLKDLEIKFGGIKDVEELPYAIFILDIRKDDLAVREAKRKGIKVIGVADTNVDPTVADYPIPANDDAISSVKYILDKVKEIILETKSKAQNPKSKTTT